MSLLQDYEQRTAWKYEPLRGCFHTPESLTGKVMQDGSYAPFPGSTVVFRLGKREMTLIELMQNVIRQRLEETDMLAFPLPAATAHMTLHDLVSPEKCVCGYSDRTAYSREVKDSLSRAAQIVERITSEHPDGKITMVADRIVNMVSKSLVLLLKPRTEADYELLNDLYRQFDEIVSLPYPLTPHITLGYFRPGMLDGDKLWEAMEFAQIRPENAPVFELDLRNLTAQYFSDMQSYSDVPARICFCCDGGLNRSVLAANILNHMARERSLPVVATARAAYSNTQGMPVSQEVWDILEKHGIQADKTYAFAKYLELGEASHFTGFAGITTGAMERIFMLGLPEERYRSLSSVFCGVRDPEYGEITYEQAFDELKARVNHWLDAYETELRTALAG